MTDPVSLPDRIARAMSGATAAAKMALFVGGGTVITDALARQVLRAAEVDRHWLEEYRDPPADWEAWAVEGLRDLAARYGVSVDDSTIG